MEAKLASLRALWDAKRQERAMPSRDDFGIHELKPWLGHLALVDVAGERTFRLCGTNLSARFGGDMTGKRVRGHRSPAIGGDGPDRQGLRNQETRYHGDLYPSATSAGHLFGTGLATVSGR